MPRSLFTFIGRFLKNVRRSWVEAGSKSDAAGGDVDADGSVFTSLCLLLVAALVARSLYVTLSGYPREPLGVAGNLVFALALTKVAGFLARSGFREATLVVRVVIAFLLIVPYASEMCVAVFHTGRHAAMVDDVFAAVDRRLAFDWLRYAHWFDAHPIVWTVSIAAYHSITWQNALLPLVLALSRRATRLYVYMLAQVLSLIAVAGVACLLPAIGAYAHAHAVSTDFIHPFLTADRMTSSILWLRGDLSGPFGVTNFGLVSFPSYHACSAVLFTWAAWETRLRWLSVAVNGVMLLGTPVHGSHYMIDVITGACLAVLMIAAARGALWRTLRSEPLSASREGVGAVRHLAISGSS